MKILLHTIALEPARWLPERVSRPLLELLPAIAAHGFGELEIYEPHLQGVDLGEISQALAAHRLSAVMLSSYLDLRPAVLSNQQFSDARRLLKQRTEALGFQKVRLFPSGKPTDLVGRDLFLERLCTLASAQPNVDFLLETHDGSLADDPQLLSDIVSDLHLPNVHLLYQPTHFDADSALAQFAIQKPLIRHLHLQNRHPDLSFATLETGVIPWPTILRALDFSVDATLEFVPVGICPPEKFHLAATLSQAAEEIRYLQKLENGAR